MAKHKRQSSTGETPAQQHQAQKKLKTGSGSERPAKSQQGPLDPTFGQRSAFPGLEDDFSYENPTTGASSDQEELDYGGPMVEMTEEEKVEREALLYLRAVRLEATGIPTVLSAPRLVEPEVDAIEDGRGYYMDGAYTAAPDKLSPEEEREEEDGEYEWLKAEKKARMPIHPQEAYFQGILRRCDKLRTQLSTAPPQSSISALSKNHAVHIGASNKDWTAWRWRIKNTDVRPAQLASLNKGSVLRLLRLVAKELGGVAGNKMITHRLSRWVWGLLARLPDRGELNSEEIGIVRELGKKAVLIGVKRKGVHDLSVLDVGDENDEEGEEDEEEEEEDMLVVVVDEDEGAISENTTETPRNDTKKDQVILDTSLNPASGEDLESVRARLLAQLETQATDEVAATSSEAGEGSLENTRATMDTILTIAGELYGQRDLLEFREAWD